MTFRTSINVTPLELLFKETCKGIVIIALSFGDLEKIMFMSHKTPKTIKHSAVNLKPCVFLSSLFRKKSWNVLSKNYGRIFPKAYMSVYKVVVNALFDIMYEVACQFKIFQLSL